MQIANPAANTIVDTKQQRFEHILSQAPFKGLKAILDSLSPDRQALCASVASTNTFEELLARLGFPVTLIPQIHVQDSYSRLGRQGGIKAVLPYHNIPTQSALPTLIHFDSTVTSTPEGAAFFTRMLVALKVQLNGGD
jgi:hypothetical protein